MFHVNGRRPLDWYFKEVVFQYDEIIPEKEQAVGGGTENKEQKTGTEQKAPEAGKEQKTPEAQKEQKTEPEKTIKEKAEKRAKTRKVTRARTVLDVRKLLREIAIKCFEKGVYK